MDWKWTRNLIPIESDGTAGSTLQEFSSSTNLLGIEDCLPIEAIEVCHQETLINFCNLKKTVLGIFQNVNHNQKKNRNIRKNSGRTDVRNKMQTEQNHVQNLNPLTDSR